jgi:hypothetical protein
MNVNQFMVKNQILIKDGSEYILQSYASTVAKISENGLELGKNWNYSKTTAKYVVKFIELYKDAIDNTLQYSQLFSGRNGMDYTVNTARINKWLKNKYVKINRSL